MRIKKYLPLILGIFFIFSIIFFKISAPDFWWHSAYGQYYIHHGFPAQDPFTYVPSPKPFYQTFLSDIILYLSYHIGGIWGLYLLKFILLFFILIILLKNNIEVNAIGLLLFALSLHYFVRPEMFSFLFFTLIVFLYTKDISYKYRWFLLFLIALLWNQHHSAIISSVIFPLSFFINSLIYKKKNFSYLADIGIILFAFIINPSGLRNTFFYLNLFNSNSFAGSITEWLPFFASQFPISLFYIILFLFLIAILIYSTFRIIIHKKNISFLIVSYIFLILTLFARRFFPYFALSSIIILSDYFKNLNILAKKTFLFLLIILFAVNIFYPSMRMPLQRGIGFNTIYDFNIVKLFKNIHIKDNIFNDYELGGFLTYNLHRKVFIYGINLNKPKLKDYIDFIKGQNLDCLIKKYNINTIILKPLKFYPGGDKIKSYLMKHKFQYFGYNLRYAVWLK